jgi:uncharacterized protein (DUF697 family)
MAKSKKPKPSFEPAADTGSGAAAPWVYRSDAGAAASAPAEPVRPKARRAVPAAAAPAASEPVVPPPVAGGTHADAAQRIVDRYARYAAGAGLMPVPLVDLAAIGGVQVAMLSALANEYGVSFSRERGKTVLAALLGGLMPSLAGHQMLKLVGPLVGILSVSGFAMASTHAVGRVFTTHFEAGGTMHDLDIEGSRRRILAQLNRS